MGLLRFVFPERNLDGRNGAVMRWLVLLAVSFSGWAQTTLPVLGVGAPPAAAGGYLHYYAITTAALQEGLADSSNFPVCVSTVGTVGCNVTTDISANLATSAHGGYVQNTVTQTGGNGGTEPADAVFGTTSTCSTLLPWETETYNATTGAWIAHVQLPTLHYLIQDTFYLCFDQNAVTTQQNTGSYAPSAVWDTYYRILWHEPTIGGSLTLQDSTTYANNATNTGGATVGTGEIDGAASFASASNQYFRILNNASFNLAAPFTISEWINITTTGGVQFLFGKSSAGQFLAQDEGSGVYRFLAEFGNTIVSSIQPSYGTWVYVTFVVTSGGQAIYINAGTPATDSTTGNGFTVVGSIYVGYSPGASQRPVNGVIDEIRLSATNRSASWITAEYNNQNASSTFLAAGSFH